MKMKKHNIMKNNMSRFLVYLLPLAIAVAGCKESFIDVSDPTRLNSSDYINNAESFKGAVTAAYGTLQPVYNSNSIQLFGDVVSDNATTQTGGAGYHVADRFIFDSSFLGFSTFWNLSYRSIAQCNIVL